MVNFRPSFKTKKEIESEQPKYENITRYMAKIEDLVTFHPDQKILDVIDIILNQRISGAPVLDEKKKLVGMLSEKDCLRLIVDRAYHNLPLRERKVSDYMTKGVFTITPDTDVVDAANQFLRAPVRRFPVVENGKLVGQVSRRDILKAVRHLPVTTW